MEHIELNNKIYGFASNFKHNKDIRTSFNKLTEATFRLNFEKWYLSGYWDDNYIPYSLLHNNKVISNVSVSKIEFIIEKEKKTGIQIGTVMTDPAYRNRGLNKFILERVINVWKEKSDFIYLFANDSVLDFYPKFNFEILDEYQYSKSINTYNDKLSVKRLNIENNKDKNLLLKTLKRSIPISKVSMHNNASLIMFYCLYFKKNSIYYIEKLKAVVMADIKGDTLYLNDVFTKETVDLNDVIKFMSNETLKRVVLGFTPLNETDFSKNLLSEEDTTLFVLKDRVDYFKGNHWMFPVLSHA